MNSNSLESVFLPRRAVWHLPVLVGVCTMFLLLFLVPSSVLSDPLSRQGVVSQVQRYEKGEFDESFLKSLLLDKGVNFPMTSENINALSHLIGQPNAKKIVDFLKSFVAPAMIRCDGLRGDSVPEWVQNRIAVTKMKIDNRPIPKNLQQFGSPPDFFEEPWRPEIRARSVAGETVTFELSLGNLMDGGQSKCPGDCKIRYQSIYVQLLGGCRLTLHIFVDVGYERLA